MKNILYKSYDMLWDITKTMKGLEFVRETPFCIECRIPLDRTHLGYLNIGEPKHGWNCSNCERKYVCYGNDYDNLVSLVRKKYEGHKRANHTIYSLDLPPTRVKDFSEDDNYWVEARIVEKNGKRQAVVYFGEKISDQTKKDYVQTFLDFDDEQLRFDKSNKSPMKLLAKLTAEFPESIVDVMRS